MGVKYLQRFWADCRKFVVFPDTPPKLACGPAIDRLRCPQAFPVLPAAFPMPASQYAIHSASVIVSDFVLKIAPLITAQTIDMDRFIPSAEAPRIET